MSNIRIPLPVKIAASVVLLVYVVLKVDVSSLFSNLSKGDPSLILLAIITAFAAMFLNSYKWQILLAESKAHASYLELVRLYFVGVFYNLVLPGQVGGEVVKGVSLARMGVGKMAAAISVAADRMTGLLALFALGITGAVLAPSVAGGEAGLLPWLVAVAFAFGVATVVLVTGRGQEAIVAVGRVLHLQGSQPTQRLASMAQQFSMPARGWSSLWLPLLISVVFQAVIVLVNLMLCSALHIPINYLQLLWVVSVVSLLQSLPISIAGIGVREGAYVYLLHQQGVDASLALALSLLIFAIQVLMAAAGGFIQLYSLLKSKR